MKTPTKISILLISAIFLFSGCEKDPLQPDKNALRISKIADNSAMQDPLWAFEYNNNGLVTKITGDWVEYADSAMITYNDENLPIEIFFKTESVYDEIRYDITWSDSNFSFSKYTGGNLQYSGDTYSFDDQGRIISVGEDYDVRWDGDRMELYSLPDELVYSFEVNEYNYPLSAINIAIINACGVSWIFSDWGDWTFQNEYCLTMNISEDGDEGSADYEYEYNDDNYPTRVHIIEEGSSLMYLYFEYEAK